MSRLFACGCALALLLGAGQAWSEDSEVELPLSVWEQMQAEIEQAAEPDRPTIPYCPIERSIQGSFRKGLFSGTLSSRFQVLSEQGHIRVPVLDAGASVGKVLLNGQRTSLLREGGMYTLGVDRPGEYRVEVEFYWGREQVDFARRLRFRVPEAGVTRLDIRIPEQDIEPKLLKGALVAVEPAGTGTRLRGALDATGILDLTWKRKLTHREGKAVRLQATVNTVFTVQTDLVSGLAVYDLTMHEGETDRIDLRLPEGIEVTSVEGDAVLQKYTDPSGGGTLTVLLRHLVADRTRLAVRFHFPAEEGKPVSLRMPLPPEGVSLEGALGVQGPAGLNVKVASVKDAKKLPTRDLPPELTDLTPNPLQHGFSFQKKPDIRLVATRHGEVKLTSTLIDELQASSVIIEDGTEITKIKLRLRNHTAQYLSLVLPEGAALTHSLVDGRPIRPATGEQGARELLFPLRQSERLRAGQTRTHVVQFGETLSGIANFYYSDPNDWSLILDDNRDRLGDEFDVRSGQVLRIPTKRGVKVEESSFVIELAYKLAHSDEGALGVFGHRAFSLPRVRGALPEDRPVDVMQATWHLYLPSAVEALSFDANLTQYSAIRYDPFRRLRDFLGGLWWTRAWAGGKYRSILVQRKEIYQADTARRGKGEAVLATFPLVGERYRFKRTLLGTETPRIAVTFAAAWLASPVRWLAFLIACGLTLLLLRAVSTWRSWLAAAVGLGALLFVAHYFLGVHRRVLWGIDLALLWGVLRLRWGPFWQRVKELLWAPWTLIGLLTWRNLAFVAGLTFILWVILMWPLLLSTVSLVVLSLWYRRKARLARIGEEVAHA